LTHGFWIQQFEVTQALWTSFGIHNPSRAAPGSPPPDPGGDCLDDPQCPVGGLTWFEALAFANILSQAHDPPLEWCYDLVDCTEEIGHGLTCASVSVNASSLYECTGYRLPTDAEYEYALRASTTEAYYFGPITPETPTGAHVCEPWLPLTEIGWYCGNSERLTQPVGQKRPNAWHLYDMAGNAREWVNDEDQGLAPPPGPLTDPNGALTVYKDRLTRGGSVFTTPTLLRSAAAISARWEFGIPTHGFRLVRTISNENSDAMTRVPIRSDGW
jgi:formylglycine-generating enzyme required for sulfatase activity